jgi:methionine sulfoxide reductase heme-binding subunit
VTQGQIVRRVVKPVVFVASLIPAALLVHDIFWGGLGANPVEEITHRTGFWGLTFLMITLSVTPVQRVTGMGALSTLRRPLGLFAFFYVVLHFTMYAVDQTYLSGLGLSPSAIAEDVAKRPYITVGFTALLLLIPLALTSTKGWIKRLGSGRWRSLHQLIYVAAALGVFHFLWLVKADTRQPVIFGIVLVVLLALRLVVKRIRKRRRLAPAGLEQPS